MQVSVEQSGDLERKMTVEVPEERISGRVKERLKELGRTVKVDGFRPGKVPFNVVERRYGAQIWEEILNDVLRSSFSEAMTLILFSVVLGLSGSYISVRKHIRSIEPTAD